MIRSRRVLLGLGLALWAGTPAMAQSNYPVNRAEVLVGAKFDFKVELEGKVAPDDIKVTINGLDAAAIFSRKPQIDANEEGLGHTAYWLRDVHLSAPGPYEVTAAANNVSQTVRWEAFGTPERRARNVILSMRGDEATPIAFRPCGLGARTHVCPLTDYGAGLDVLCTAAGAIEAVRAGLAVTVASKRAHPAAQGPASRALLGAPLPISGAGRNPDP